MTDPLEQLTDVIQRERRALVGMATREGLTAEESLECVQDALCTWLARRQGSSGELEPAPLGPALKLMVKNHARNWRRRHRRLKVHTEISDAEPELADARSHAEALLEAAEASLRLHVCVGELREVERAVVCLRLLEERSGEDVARALGLSRAHVDVLVHRAKAALRICMRAPSCASDG